jgi:pimeloyl-ACP methyl ester carboxylesterase
MDTVVLLHSSGASSRQWDRLAEALAPHARVHAVDLHGHGRQRAWPGERPMTLADEAALVRPLIERERGGVHLVGHSYGGALALNLALTSPRRVRSLAVYEPVLFRLLIDHEPTAPASCEVFELAERVRCCVRDGRFPAAAALFTDYWSGPGAWSRLAPDRQVQFAARMPLVVAHFEALFAEPLPGARLARLTMPTLCLTGETSTGAARRMAALLQGLLPAACHQTLAGMGHMGPLTHADEVNRRLLAFLTDGGGLSRPETAQRSQTVPAC